MLTPWLKSNGRKIMDQNGQPVLCEDCPCGEGCEEMLGAIKTQMVSDVAWRLVREEQAHYECEASDSDSSILYSGTLVVVLPRDVTFSNDYIYAVHAIEYERILDGHHRVYACACKCGGDYTYQELDNYGIADVVVADTDEVCKPANMCAVFELELAFLAGIHGGRLYGEGFFDWLGTQDDWHYQPFRKAWVYDMEASDSGTPTTTRLAWIECQCTGRASSMYKGGEIDVHGVDYFCDTPCQDLLVLRERAVKNGWEWHDAGIIVHKAYNFGDGSQCNVCAWYDLDDRIRVMGAAEDSGHIYYVGCGCWNGVETISKSSWPDMIWPEPPEGCTPDLNFWQILDWEYACKCNGVRELLLEFPDVFGVVSLSWGSDEKVRLTHTWDDPMEPAPVITTQISTISQLLGGDQNYIDYRTLSVVRHRCPTGYTLTAYNDQGSRWGTLSLYDGDYEPVFLGPRTTWGQDPDVGDRTGHVVAWWMGCSEQLESCFDNQNDAENYYNQWGKNPSKPTACGIRDYYQSPHASLIEPETGLSYITGGVHEIVHQDEWEDPDGETHVDTWSEWCVTNDQWCPNGGFQGYYGTAIYYLNWLETNRGLMFNGVDGYHQTWTIYGIQGAKGDSTWGSCFGHSVVPNQNETLTASWYNPGFHWCIPDYVPPTEDSDSTSESI